MTGNLTETAEKTGVRGGQRAVILCVLLALGFGPLNSTMITVALPHIAEDLSLAHSTTSWIVTVYLIAMAALHPVAGKLGDRWDRRRLMLGAIVLALVASVAASLSTALVPLVLFRLLQAVAGAAITPNGMALLRQAVPPERLGRVMGWAGACLTLAATVGPLLGTGLVTAFGWQSIFLVNVVLMAGPLVLGIRYLPRPPERPEGEQAAPARRFDVLGAVLACVVLIALALLLDVPSSQLQLIVCAVVFCVALPVLLVRELRCADPALQPRLFARPRFLVAALGVCLSNFALYGVLLAVPALFVLREDWPTAGAGVALAVMTGLSALLTPYGGRLVDRYGPTLPAATGMALATLGLALVAFGTGSLPLPVVGVGLGVVGVGLALCNPAYQTESVQSVPEGQTGMASGLYSTSRYVGSIAVSSLLGGPLAAHSTGAASTGYAVFGAVTLIGAVLTVVLPRLGKREEAAA